jgi:hypothetical protein
MFQNGNAALSCGPCTRNNALRGIEVRKMLMAAVRACHRAGKPLPTQAVLGQVIGIDPSQIGRHLARLQNEGMFVVRRAKKRQYIREVRP